MIVADPFWPFGQFAANVATALESGHIKILAAASRCCFTHYRLIHDVVGENLNMHLALIA
ncbi:hypothetical protein WL16_26925 [Burkholderia ubonensis]|nr:hypothetical protein WJ67_01105 [Burkholderia ubonensis]KVV10217.1 hypothetical protein WK77_12310 [Burkholderia ubonensis]KVZ43002.1 hypothetical protein WL16_26925 [Burkholderia ubonensis]